MKKILIASALLALCFAFTGCEEKKYDTITSEYSATEHDVNLRISVASDLHVGAWDTGNISFKGDYAPGILDAFINDIKNEGTDLLVLCGDISNSARYSHHQELIEKLQQIENDGIQVCVIPGNHDIGQMKKEEFSEYYADFGYNQAVSRDENTLSYAYVVKNTLLVMLDTDGYTDYRYAEIPHSTLVWMKNVFDYGVKNGLNILPVGHFPVITNHTTAFHGRDDVIALFNEYSIPLYLSGHLHGRSVNSDGQLTELVVEQLTSYPCSYGIIDIDTKGDIYYKPQKLNISTWAKDSGQGDELLLDFEEMGRKSAEEFRINLIDNLCKERYASQADKKKRCEFYGLLSECLSNGTVYRNKDLLMSHPGYNVFMRICQGSNYAPWIPSLFEKASPYTEGFVIKNGVINTN